MAGSKKGGGTAKPAKPRRSVMEIYGGGFGKGRRRDLDEAINRQTSKKRK